MTAPAADAQRAYSFRDGAAFVLDTPQTVPVVWGLGNEVLWAEGEALMIVGPQGVGKSTIMQQVVRARLGLDEDVLGYPVAPTSRRVLYLACDRPRQISRSLHRMFSEEDRELLHDRLVVWSGPPPYDFAQHPSVLARMCEDAGADTVVIDSIKDVAIGLQQDEIGAAYNRARQTALEAGVQVLEAHHQTKHGAGGQGVPDSLSNVFGSVWLTAGAGSTLLVWGAAGDPIVELRHLKQPAEEVGPIKVIHDHDAGRSAVWHAIDLLALAKASPGGVTAKSAAAALFSTDKPNPSDTEKARRRLEALVRGGQLVKRDGDPGSAVPTAYFPGGLLPLGAAA